MYNQTWKINKDKAGEILRNPDSTAIALFIIAIKTVGEENLIFPDEDTGYTDHMDPLELFEELESEFRVRIAVENENRLNALLTAFTTNLFFEDPIGFTSICLAIHSGDLAELVNGVMEEPNIEEILTAKMEIEMLIEPQEFSKSVQELISSSIKDLAEDDEVSSPEESLNYLVETHRTQIVQELLDIGLDDKMVEFVRSHNVSV